MGLAGLGQFRCFGLLGCRSLNGGEDQGGGALDDFKTFGQECGVAVVKVDVVGGGPARVETNSQSWPLGSSLVFARTDTRCLYTRRSRSAHR